jgi:hypothetical protein
MLHSVIDSATGDVLGHVIIDRMDDEEILERLYRAGYLAGGPEYYEITRCYPFAEGKIVVLDLENQTPVLALEDPDDGDTQQAA